VAEVDDVAVFDEVVFAFEVSFATSAVLPISATV
jgi:hypothetical protein